MSGPGTVRAPSIWWWAFGYFACYVPYSALTKMVSSGKDLIDTGSKGGVPGLELLPATVMAAVLTLIVFLIATGWWRYAGRRRVLGREMPFPGRLTFVSGLCSAGIIATTTLAYTFTGVSLVFVGLLMRGGVLVLAPLVDLLFRRKVRWFSYAALVLSLSSLIVTSTGGDTAITLLCGIDVACYLGFYFARLSLMSRKAKSKDPATNLRYFVEEGMVSAPALLVMLVVAAALLGGQGGADLRAGFTSFWERPIVIHALAIGILSQGTGIFGGLVFLDPRENTFCVPVNRASSVLAVLLATIVLSSIFAAYPGVPTIEFVGAGLILGAIGFLTIPPALAKRAAARLAAAPLPTATARQ